MEKDAVVHWRLSSSPRKAVWRRRNDVTDKTQWIGFKLLAKVYLNLAHVISSWLPIERVENILTIDEKQSERTFLSSGSCGFDVQCAEGFKEESRLPSVGQDHNVFLHAIEGHFIQYIRDNTMSFSGILRNIFLLTKTSDFEDWSIFPGGLRIW